MTSGNSDSERMHYHALRIRMVEERIIELYPSDKIQSPVHLSIGQEAVAAGICHCLEEADPLFGSYRSHAFYLAKGGDLKAMFAELYGKQTGCGAGKAGSMHLAAPEVGFMGSSAVVASAIPHAVGMAMAVRRLKQERVTVCVFGDGATEEGVYHESLNYAALHQLPVILVCENNRLAVHASLADRQSYEIMNQAACYGLKTRSCAEGYDYNRVQSTFAAAVEDIRLGQGPQFVEILTYRYKEHVGPGEDHDAGYRSSGDLDDWQTLDPLIQRQDLRSKFEDQIRVEIEQAVEFAEHSPFPGVEELLTDV